MIIPDTFPVAPKELLWTDRRLEKDGTENRYYPEYPLACKRVHVSDLDPTRQDNGQNGLDRYQFYLNPNDI